MKAADLVSQNLGQTWSSFEDLGSGVYVYRDVLPESLDIINRIENVMSEDNPYNWQQAMVGYSQVMKDYRDCVDFKYKQENLGTRDQDNSELLDLHQEIYEKLKYCVDDYASYWGINVVYYEAFNFVKYEGKGSHFNVHADHGPVYNCTVSAVVYINEDYEGGDLKFPRLDNLVYKPKVGDIVLCPSNYIYEHASLPIESGTKYCVVVMTDINELGHRQ
jgi:hypothetical protein